MSGSGWRPCPDGKHWRREHYQSTYRTLAGKLVRGHQVSAGCCDNPSKKDQIYSEELRIIAKEHFSKMTGPPDPNDLGFGGAGSRYDALIRGWTRFWNDVLEPKDPLDPDLVKALVASESGFDPDPPKPRNSKVRGLMQLTDLTQKILGDEKGELKDHLVHVSQKDMTDPVLNIAAGTRWLFQKKKLAGVRLKRTASWDEAVAEYKDYLRKMIKDPKLVPRGMTKFRNALKRLKHETKDD